MKPSSPAESGVVVGVQHACPICGGSLVKSLKFAEMPRVTSDCRPWPAGGALGVCANCGSIAKPLNNEFITSAASIYADYQPYEQSAGHEQKVFDNIGTSCARSERLVGLLASKQLVDAESGTLIDFGCGSGVFLREFLSQNAKWRAVGVDTALHLADAVNAIGRATFVTRLDDACKIVGKDERVVVSMIHSLEHVESPRQTLGGIAESFPKAVLLVQVPDNLTNPFDVAVADHRTHFTRDSLLSLLRSLFNSRSCFVIEGLVPKELTAIVFPTTDLSEAEALPHSMTAEQLDLDCRISGLLNFIHRVRFVANKTSIHIFGSSIAASWVAGSLPRESVRAFVDEDLYRIGRRHLGIPIMSPSSLPNGASIVLPFPEQTAREIASRLGLCSSGIFYPRREP